MVFGSDAITPSPVVTPGTTNWESSANLAVFFSNWLAESGPNHLVRVSAPQGCLLPKAKDERPLIYLVAGIGVTPAIAGVRQLRHERSITVVYSFRGEPEAPYLDELRQFANASGNHPV